MPHVVTLHVDHIYIFFRKTILLLFLLQNPARKIQIRFQLLRVNQSELPLQEDDTEKSDIDATYRRIEKCLRLFGINGEGIQEYFNQKTNADEKEQRFVFDLQICIFLIFTANNA